MSVTSPARSETDLSATTFRLKGGLFPLTTLELTAWDAQRFPADLQQKVAEAPGFFQSAPVILALDGLPEAVDLPLAELVTCCREHGLLPLGIRGANPAREAAARELGLVCFPGSGRSRGEAREQRTPAQRQTPDRGPEAPVQVAASPSRVVTTPIRSGQQVYAAGGDLIVLSSVSEGAEVLADGNIHVYGSLRGRALAGVRGDSQARIFCQCLEAELVSVAGNFKLHEDLQGELWKQPVQISLDDQSLKVVSLV